MLFLQQNNIFIYSYTISQSYIFIYQYICCIYDIICYGCFENCMTGEISQEGEMGQTYI